jgi:hypothetical protein
LQFQHSNSCARVSVRVGDRSIKAVCG